MKFSVMQWNVWYKESNQNIANFLKERKADIVCLQELTIEEGDRGHAPKFIAGQLGYEYYCKEIDLGDDKINLANGIFSRFPIIATNCTWINEPRGTDGYDDEYQVFIEATLRVGDRQITVGTTHMSYTHQFEVTPRKSQETDSLIAEVSKHKDNFILTGDLNAAPGSYTVKSLERHLVNAGPEYQEPTWTTKPFSYNGFKETELAWRLDYIFASPDLRVVSSEAIKTDYSDHLPILCSFDLT